MDTTLNTQNPLSETVELSVPSPQKLARAEKVVDNLISTNQMSLSGLAFLKVATDPWHDNKIDGFKGVPDYTMGNSVVCSIVQELDISKLAALPAGNWGVRIMSYPLAQQISVTSAALESNILVNTGPPIGVNGTIYPIQVDYAPSGTDFPDGPNFGASTLSTGLQIPPEYLEGPYKVASIGIEVVNTTAEIQLQGLATCSRMNQSADNEFSAIHYATPLAFTVGSHYPVRTGPKNLSEAILLPDTTQWHAKEGAYSVVQLQQLGTRPPSIDPVFPVFMPADFPATGSIAVFAPTLTTAVVAGASALFPAVNPGRVPMNTTCQMYTGLSDQTTLTLRVRWILERYPNDNQPQILVLATPTASFDPLAIEVYSRLMRKIPPGVMFKENHDQEWWKTMLSGIADVASSGLMMLPHPLAKGAGIALNMASNYLRPAPQKVHRAALEDIAKVERRNKEQDDRIREQKRRPVAPHNNANISKAVIVSAKKKSVPKTLASSRR